MRTEDAGGFFFTSHDHEVLLHRPKSGPDDAIPSGNGAAIRALGKLGHLLGNTKYLASAEKRCNFSRPRWQKCRPIHGSLLMAQQACAPTARTVILRGPAAELAEWRAFCQRAQSQPETAVFAIPNGAELPPALARRKAGESGVLAYVCTGTECAAPVGSQGELGGMIGG